MVGLDRPTLLPFTGSDRAWLFSAQIFQEWIMDWKKREAIQSTAGFPALAPADISTIFTLLVQGNYFSDRLTLTTFWAYETAGNWEANNWVQWRFTDNWLARIDYNAFFGSNPYVDLGLFRHNSEVGGRVIFQF
jgi:hypothetical protein